MGSLVCFNMRVKARKFKELELAVYVPAGSFMVAAFTGRAFALAVSMYATHSLSRAEWPEKPDEYISNRCHVSPRVTPVPGASRRIVNRHEATECLGPQKSRWPQAEPASGVL